MAPFVLGKKIRWHEDTPNRYHLPKLFSFSQCPVLIPDMNWADVFKDLKFLS